MQSSADVVGEIADEQAFSPDFNATTGAGLIAIADFLNRSVVVFSYS